MDSQQVLYIILIALVFMFGLFLTIRRKPDLPTKLNIKAGEDFDKFKLPVKEPTNQTKKTLETKVNHLKLTSPETPAASSAQKPPADIWLEPEQTPGTAKNLSIFFMYNGHDWEAHDVLGVPRGVNLTMATEAYQKLLINEDPSTFEFYEGAYNAILQRRKKERL